MKKEVKDPGEKGFLRQHFEFAGSMILHPIKTVKNITAALQEAPLFTAEKVVFGASTVFGAAALGIGVINADPLLSVIGTTFLTIGGNRLNAVGDKVRTERHAEGIAEEPVIKTDTEDAVKPAVPEPEKTASEKLADVLGKDDGGKGGFKPDLARFKKPAGPESAIDGGP